MTALVPGAVCQVTNDALIEAATTLTLGEFIKHILGSLIPIYRYWSTYKSLLNLYYKINDYYDNDNNNK